MYKNFNLLNYLSMFYMCLIDVPVSLMMI